jgi:DNA-binding NtrC family response regulator
MTAPLQKPSKKHPETILVVDDEPSILEYIKKVLERADYRVLTSPNAAQAWKRIKRGNPKISLVLTDIIMPGSIDGSALAEKIRGSNPQLLVLLMTGASSKTEEQAAEIRNRQVLWKPFSPQQLADFIVSGLSQGVRY